jgi:hypothetical protein
MRQYSNFTRPSENIILAPSVAEVTVMKRRIHVFSALVITVGLLLVWCGVTSAQEITATEFKSSGDEIAGWYWLRDEGMQYTAEWTFCGIPNDLEPIILNVHALATDRASGGRGFSAKFRLIYGFPGSGAMGGVFETKEITLPNVSTDDDPLGYDCLGTVIVSRSAFRGATSLWFRIERISHDDPHVAFNKESIAILLPDQVDLELVTAPAGSSNFSATGDYISGSNWCRRDGHILEWTWKPIERGYSIIDAAVNFSLLVTNTFDGGSGFSAIIPLTILNLENDIVELGLLEVTNPFLPKFNAYSKGIGYTTTGAYKLQNPELLMKGFKLQLTWPAVASSVEEGDWGGTRHFAGNNQSAFLAYIIAADGKDKKD